MKSQGKAPATSLALNRAKAATPAYAGRERSCRSCCAMGRKLAEATKACRMRRTRGEIGRRFRVVVAWGLTALVLGFLTGGVWLAGALLVVAAFLRLAAP